MPDAPVVSFTLLGHPIPWARVSQNKAGFSFVPREVRDAEKAIGLAYRAAGGRVIDAPVALGMTFYLGAFGPARKRVAGGAHLDPRDLSNLIKLVEDGLRGIAYPDDRRVVAYYPVPMKILDPANPRTVVTVRTWPLTPEVSGRPFTA